MPNLLKLFLLSCMVYLFAGCNDKDDFTAITYPDMVPGMQVTEIITGNPGDEVHIKAQLADVHGLKKLNISSESLPLEHTVNLEGNTTYLLDYLWTIPQDVEIGSQHTILLTAEGNTETITKQVLLLASKATDYEVMYAAYEGETEELWNQCLNKKALPRIMERTAPYNYTIILYSPAAGTRVSLLGQKAMTPDMYGVNPDNSNKIAIGQQYISLPEEGYYTIAVNLQTCDYSLNKVVPALPVYQLYILGDLINSGWNFEEGKNDMIPVYENNPYLVRRSLKFKDTEGGIKFANLDWSVQINPLSGYTSWEDIGKWTIINWDDDQTQDIWLPTPGGFYEVTLDYYLGEVTIVAKEEEVTEDYDKMYVAYENEPQADWDNALSGLPRVAERTAPYTYTVELYAPVASTRIKYLTDTDIATEGYGENAQKGTYISLPEVGYYRIEMNLSSHTSKVEKLTPSGNIHDKIYIVGSLTESAWDFKDDVNLMQVVNQDNPYMVRKEVKFISNEDGDLAFSTPDWIIWKPLKECSTWSEINKWGISDGSNTQDIWWKAPVGTYEVTFDYYLGRATLIKK